MVRGSSGVLGRRAILLCAALALTVACALPSVASAQGQGKRILLYTGTTGFRHTDGDQRRPPDRPAQSSRRLGFTVDWEDCTNHGTTPTTTNCNHADKNPRIFTAAEPRAL